MRETFSDRLSRCVSKADLTVADITRWFDRPRATVDTWLNGRTPMGPSGVAAEHDLQRLEWAISKRLLPLPPRLTLKARMAHLHELRADATRHARVPSVHTAARGG